MFKGLKKLVNSLTHQRIKLNIELLSGDIIVPEGTEEYNYFSIQGNLIIDTPVPKHVNNIAILFSGNLDNFKNENFDFQNPYIVHNQFELLSQPVQIFKGTSVFEFELALPRSLPSSTKSILFGLDYSLTAFIEFKDKTKLTKRKSVKVYNGYLLPFREIRQNYYENHGTVRDLVDYGIEFNSRIFDIEEFAKFKLKLEPLNGASISFIQAKLLQETVIYSNSNNLAENEELKPITQFISQCSFNLVYKYSKSTFEIELPITSNSLVNKSILIPTMDTKYFKIAHSILIEVNYIPPEQLSKKKFSLAIPVAICCNFKALISLNLPIYDDIGKSSDFFLTGELPPVYSI